MYILVQDVPAVVTEYVNTVIVPKASTKGLLATIGFMIGGQGVGVGVGNMLKQYEPILRSFSIITEEGRINLSDVKERAENAMKLAGGKLDLWGGFYSFDNEDITSLLSIAQKYGKE
jgi:hypothetical protein